MHTRLTHLLADHARRTDQAAELGRRPTPGCGPEESPARRYGHPVDRPDELQVQVRRSRRRRSTVTAYRDGATVVVLLPARLSSAQEREWVRRMVARLDAQDRRRRPGDAELAARGQALSERYLAGRARPLTVSWATNQHHRWGSCTPADGSIRLSTRLRGMPPWVLDYVLLHELAHLLEAGHGAAFWQLLEAYPKTERARGFLDGFAAAQSAELAQSAQDDDLPDPGGDQAGDG